MAERKRERDMVILGDRRPEEWDGKKIDVILDIGCNESLRGRR